MVVVIGQGPAVLTRLPAVSIVMPVYNAEAYLAEALGSVCRQSFSDFELLAIDDGSTDASPRILTEWTDPRMRVILTGEHRGLPRVLNTGMSHARGRFVARMDADDIMEPDRLAAQVAFLDRMPAVGVCGSWMRGFDASTHLFRYAETHEAIVCELLFDSHIPHPAAMIRAEVLAGLDPVYDPDFVIAEEYDLWLRLRGTTRFANIPRVLHQYRVQSRQAGSVLSREVKDLNRRLHARLLSELALPTDDGTLDLHTAIASWAMPRDLAALDAAHDWFERILAANDRASVYEPQVLRAALARRFFFLCNLYTQHGPGVLARFHRYALHREADIPAAQSIRQVLKAFLHIDAQGRLEKKHG